MNHEQLTTLKRRIDQRRREADALKTRHDILQETRSNLQNELQTLNDSVERAQAARLLFETITEKKQELVRTKIEALVTHGIQSVFGESYAFKIEQRMARNQVTFDYRILHSHEGEIHESDLRGAHGGGLVALVGFLLRVVMVLFAYPPRRRIIFLDETMAALDGDKRSPFAALLRSLGNQLDMQFVLITHSSEYATDADVVYEVTPVGDGISKLIRKD